MMHEREKSDPAVVAVKPVNNAERSAAEPVEPRAGAKGNAEQHSTCRAQYRVSVSQALERIRQVRRHSPEVGAVCGKAARTDLCGGRSEMSVPTAIAPLAMTSKHTFTPSRRNAPEALMDLPPKEGVGNAGCPWHPQPRVRLLIRFNKFGRTRKLRSPDGAQRNPGITRRRPRISLRSIRACMGMWLSRGVIDQGMLFPRSLAWSAMRS